MQLDEDTKAEDQTTETETEAKEEESQEVEETSTETPDDETSESETETTEEEDEGELVVTIGDAEPEAKGEEEEISKAPQWVRDQRKENRELKKRLKALEKEKEQANVVETTMVKPKKPLLSDFDFDEDAHSEAVDKYTEDLIKYNDQQKEVTAKQEAENKKWEQRTQAYNQRSEELGVDDFQDAEASTMEHLNITQQGMIVAGADDPALVVYALGKNPEKAKELAAIEDPVQFAFAAAKLETQLKTTKRKRAPAPEKRVSGGSAPTGKNELDRLEREAAKTGDRTKVIAYKRKMREK